MEALQNFVNSIAWLIPFILFCAIWDSVWKFIGLWRAARNNDLLWFICIAVFNTLGILPIIYIILDKKKAANKA
ncbi:MAG: DUF5652 family protein [Bacteroidales bacterium]